MAEKRGAYNKIEWNERKEEQLRYLRSQGKTYEEIASAMGITRNAVNYRLNIAEKKKDQIRNDYTPFQIDETIRLRENGKKYREIAKQLGLTMNSVKYIMHAYHGKEEPEKQEPDEYANLYDAWEDMRALFGKGSKAVRRAV